MTSAKKKLIAQIQRHQQSEGINPKHLVLQSLDSSYTTGSRLDSQDSSLYNLH